jgi:hypothetical protein
MLQPWPGSSPGALLQHSYVHLTTSFQNKVCVTCSEVVLGFEFFVGMLSQVGVCIIKKQQYVIISTLKSELIVAERRAGQKSAWMEAMTDKKSKTKDRRTKWRQKMFRIRENRNQWYDFCFMLWKNSRRVTYINNLIKKLYRKWA